MRRYIVIFDSDTGAYRIAFRDENDQRHVYFIDHDFAEIRNVDPATTIVNALNAAGV